MKQPHLLIFRFSALGDVAMTVPLVESLAKQYPELQLTVVSRSFARCLFEGRADNLHFFAADLKGEHHGVRGLWRLFRQLHKLHPTHVADLHNVLRTKVLRFLFMLSGTKVAHLHKPRRQQAALTRVNNKKVLQPLRPVAERYRDVVERLGWPVENHFNTFFPSREEALRRLPASLCEELERHIAIGIAPFAAHTGKIYPLEKTTRLIEDIHRQWPEAVIYLFGGGQRETEILQSWQLSHDYCHAVPLLLRGLDNEMALMSQLHGMVAMDSANMHLAAIAGAPVISVWGATHPYAGFMPWRQPMENCIQTDHTCRPCSIYGSRPCRWGDYRCMQQIDEQTIMDRLQYVIDAAKTS